MSTSEKMADRLVEFIEDCDLGQLLDLYQTIFGADELTEQLQQKIAGRPHNPVLKDSTPFTATTNERYNNGQKD